MEKSKILQTAFKQGVEITRDDNFVTLPDQKYLERHLLFNPQNGYYYIIANVYDISIEYCYYSAIKEEKDYRDAENTYYQTVRKVEDMEFEINPDHYC